MICPCCKKRVTKNHFACQSGSKGGKAKSDAKTKANKANAEKRWAGRPKKTKGESK